MNTHEAERVIVVSDAHGHVELIENALGHAGFDATRDGLIYAGDLPDGQASPAEVRECIALLKDRRAQFLWGNHDVAALLDYHIDYQEPETRPSFTGLFRDEFRRTSADRWRLAVRVQGVFVTHAGISTDYLNDYLYADKSHRVHDPEGFVERLNGMFDQAARRQLASSLPDKLDRIMGRRAPHRFRVFRPDMTGLVLPGVVQVAGHSAPETHGSEEQRRALALQGFHIVDPCYQCRSGTSGFRYGVIENGEVRVVTDSGPARTGGPARFRQ